MFHDLFFPFVNRHNPIDYVIKLVLIFLLNWESVLLAVQNDFEQLLFLRSGNDIFNFGAGLDNQSVDIKDQVIFGNVFVLIHDLLKSHSFKFRVVKANPLVSDERSISMG